MNIAACRYLILIIVLNVLPVHSAFKLSKCLENVKRQDTLINVWVIFSDKPNVNLNISDAALNRRKSAGYELIKEREKPVSGKYIDEIIEHKGKLRHVFKWANAASFSIPAAKLNVVVSLSFVKKVIPVSVFKNPDEKTGLFKEQESVQDEGIYGYAYEQLDLMNVPVSHDFVNRVIQEMPGQGVRIAVFDNGFYLDHPCFDSLVESGRIIADSDFVANDNDPYYNYSVHGAKTMAQIAGYDPGNFAGTAWGAEFILARTEEDGIEVHQEEDNWAAAVVWAESIGVDIISSSVGYRYGFTDSMGYKQISEDYTFEDMDGKTTIIALAAREAIERGVLIVNSMGNESDHTSDNIEYKTIVSPADVEGVISVGAINYDLKIADFSSTGPTAAGIIKPDCVAPGSGVYNPGTTGYTKGSGTSYSAPLVAGILAVIRQVFSGYSPGQVRERLYSSCFLSPYQDSADNIYGRGIPDAFKAVYGDTANVCLYITDYLKNGINGAVLQYNGNTKEITDNSGFALIDKEGIAFPAEIVIAHEDYLKDTLTIYEDSIFYNRSLSRSVLNVLLTREGKTASLKTGTVYYSALKEDGFDSSLIDSNGFGEIVRNTKMAYIVYGSSSGYYNSPVDTLEADDIRDTVVLTFQKRPLSELVVYPTVISARQLKKDRDKRINIEFFVDGDISSAFSMRIAVRTLSGGLVWTFHRDVSPGSPFTDLGGETVGWDCRREDNSIVAPGVYIISIQCNDKTYIKKVLING